ncbi:hypothetical protein [Streptomyces sp. NRRL F-4489]|uniref:hypothetical protein n=1 Tax=Streptomyces sp. NRRL F-4489 TaxID=1609095 RepID=UPI00131BCC2B|nr:hypothetical protein [Streptomyces sp. NRRL F-4489]
MVLDSPSATEVKRVDSTHFAALAGDGVAIVNEVPTPHLETGFCLPDTHNQHSLEVLPDHQVAVSEADGVYVYDLDKDHPRAKKFGSGKLFSSHTALWDAASQDLYVTGTSKAKLQGDGIVAVFHYDTDDHTLIDNPRIITITKDEKDAEDLSEANTPHDLAGVPGKRELLISTENEVFVYNLDTQQLIDARDYPFDSPYLAEYKSPSRIRNEKGYATSRFKSLGQFPDGTILYTQPTQWGSQPAADLPTAVNLYKAGSTDPDHQPAYSAKGDPTIYKARIFDPTPGWPAASESLPTAD